MSVRVVFIFGGCGGRALREPPKITPLRGEVVRTLHTRQPLPRQKCVSAMPPNVSEDWHLNGWLSKYSACCSPTAVGMRQQSAAWGAAANCAVLKNRKYFYDVSTFCHPKGGAKMCRGETISGSATAPALNRMPSALLKQSKDFRFLTLRRRGRPPSEIASAAGRADACEYCDSQSRAGRSLGARRPATHFTFVCALRRLRPENIPITMSAVLQNRTVRRRPTAADCNSPRLVSSSAVGEQPPPGDMPHAANSRAT